jgi:hypothetical protein
MRDILEILTGFNGNSNRLLKLKDKYPKLIFLKSEYIFSKVMKDQ